MQKPSSFVEGFLLGGETRITRDCVEFLLLWLDRQDGKPLSACAPIKLGH